MAYSECKIIDSYSFADNTILLNIKHSNIAEIVLNRSEKHNALDQNMILGLNQVFDQLNAIDTNYNNTGDTDNKIRLLVLKSTGKTFCAGADLNHMKASKNFSYGQNIKDAEILSDALHKLADFHAPTIAIVQGSAFGGGVGLICCCDLAIGVKRSTFCLSEVKLGIIPAVISNFLIDTMGYKTAKKHMLTGESFNGQRAYDLNMLSDLVDSVDVLDNKVDQVIDNLLLNSPEAMIEVKNLLKTYNTDNKLDNYKELAITAIAEIRTSKEGQEGLSAFLEKRKASWI